MPVGRHRRPRSRWFVVGYLATGLLLGGTGVARLVPEAMAMSDRPAPTGAPRFSPGNTLPGDPMPSAPIIGLDYPASDLTPVASEPTTLPEATPRPPVPTWRPPAPAPQTTRRAPKPTTAAPVPVPASPPSSPSRPEATAPVPSPVGSSPEPADNPSGAN